MKKLAIILVIISSASVTAVAGGAVKKWYWSSAQASATVIAKVRVPYCRVYPSAIGNCADGKPLPGKTNPGISIEAAHCAGSNELAQTFKYNRFSCDFTLLNDYAEGTIAIYPAGKTAFRWKVLSIG